MMQNYRNRKSFQKCAQKAGSNVLKMTRNEIVTVFLCGMLRTFSCTFVVTYWHAQFHRTLARRYMAELLPIQGMSNSLSNQLFNQRTFGKHVVQKLH